MTFYVSVFEKQGFDYWKLMFNRFEEQNYLKSHTMYLRVD